VTVPRLFDFTKSLPKAGHAATDRWHHDFNFVDTAGLKQTEQWPSLLYSAHSKTAAGMGERALAALFKTLALLRNEMEPVATNQR
jgi:hypothetical protein